jgi:hypothetical protein
VTRLQMWESVATVVMVTEMDQPRAINAGALVS